MKSVSRPIWSWPSVKVQDCYKLWAVLLPPIPPLIVALVVFFNRRASEREGVSTRPGFANHTVKYHEPPARCTAH